jgi:undecaprenyl-diphosphatase
VDVSQAPVWLQAAILGLIQGLTEFLPISSSGHLVLIPQLTRWKHLGKEFDVALHFGTLLALMAYFQNDVSRLFEGLFGLLGRVPRRDRSELTVAERLTLHVAIASLPAGALGFFGKDFLHRHFDHMGSIAVCLALFGMMLGLADRVGTQGQDNLSEIPFRGSWKLGLAQALALLPGVSRSGASMSMALWLGLTRVQAARISFLMALPVTAAACLLEAWDVRGAASPNLFYPCLIGITVSAASGWFSIKALLGYLQSHSFTPFVVYRLILATFLFFWMLTQPQ